MFDSKKKLKAMSADGLEHKLTKLQHQSLEVNKALLNMYTNQVCIINLLFIHNPLCNEGE